MQVYVQVNTTVTKGYDATCMDATNGELMEFQLVSGY